MFCFNAITRPLMVRTWLLVRALRNVVLSEVTLALWYYFMSTLASIPFIALPF